MLANLLVEFILQAACAHARRTDVVTYPEHKDMINSLWYAVREGGTPRTAFVGLMEPITDDQLAELQAKYYVQFYD